MKEKERGLWLGLAQQSKEGRFLIFCMKAYNFLDRWEICMSWDGPTDPQKLESQTRRAARRYCLDRRRDRKEVFFT